MCLPLAAYVFMMCGAWVLDQRECYSAVVPHWAVPGETGFPLWRQMIYMGRTQLSLLRPLHVSPGALTLTLTLTVTLTLTLTL